MIKLISLAISVGFFHAFEVDHMVAVSNLVTQRKKMSLALKDGVFWGLGHSTIIILAGLVFMLGRFVINEHYFRYFESLVGLMLIFLGVYRFTKMLKNSDKILKPHSHSLAYSVGALHGLAGSGAILITLIQSEKNNFHGLLYLIIFGLGSIIGMAFVSACLSIPFTTKILQKPIIFKTLSLFSCLACIVVGFIILRHNLWMN